MKNTPKLRFPEFSEEWDEYPLGEWGDFLKGATLSKAHLSKSGKPCILYGELYTKYSEVIENVVSKTDLEDKKLVIGNKNDVLIPSSGETAIDIATASCLQKDNIILGGDLNVFRSNKVDGRFISYQLNSSKRKEIAKLAQGASVVHLYNKQLTKLKIDIPESKEQQKIASFFSLMDQKIEKQQKKVESLKEYKKGIMQKIFSQEARFKNENGEDYSDWIPTTIDKIAILEKGFTPDTKNDSYWDGEIPWLSIADMKKSKYVTKVSKHISKDALKNKKLIPIGTLIMSFKLTIGRLAIVKREMITNEAICHFYWKDNNVITEYMYYYLNSIRIDSFGSRAAKGITLNNDSLSSIVVKLPIVEEQEKIADYLIKLDQKLEKEQEKLDLLNQYKKGLLQQMFV